MADQPDYSRIIYQPGPVARIIMNRPKWNNALSHPMYKEVESAFDRAARDPEVKVIILSGAGHCFSAGHDAIGVGTSPEAAPVLADALPPEEQMKRFPSEHELWREYWIEHNWYIDEMHTVKIVPHPKPTIAMVHGYAIYGGMGMACCMDIIFATEDALFLTAGSFENERTGIGWRKAAEFAYEHRFMTGREAYNLGVVNRVFPDFETLERETLAYAGRVASQTPQLLMEAKKRLINARGLAGTYYSSAGLTPGISGNGIPEEYAHDRRYEGRGMARTPRALASLKAMLDSEGRPVPQNVLEALARAAARDPQASWAKALDAEWRDPESRERARRQREAWNARLQREEEEKRRGEAGHRAGGLRAGAQMPRDRAGARRPRPRQKSRSEGVMRMDQHASLAGLRVLDLSQQVAGGYCTTLLAGLGAEVIKIEPPGGDSLRKRPPFAGGEPGPERGALFLHLNTGKKSAVLDLRSDEGADGFLRLAASADVVVESFAPGTMARLGIHFGRLRNASPGVILTSISNFGQQGPYRDYLGTEIVFMALGGFMYVTGDPDREPVKLCGPQAQYQAGLHATVATLAALQSREETGRGQWVDVSIAESLAFLAPRDDPSAPDFKVPVRSGNRNPGRSPSGPYPSTTLPCKDGHVHVHSKHWAPDALARLMDEPGLATPEVLRTPTGHADEIDRLMQPWLLARTKMEVLGAAQAEAVPFGAVLDMPEVLDDPQHASRGYFAPVRHPELGEVTVSGPPMRMSGTPWITSRPPLVGEQTEEVLAALNTRPVPDRVLARDQPDEPVDLPLAGLRVLDLTQILAGPTVTQLLADLGAEVIKIESHTRPDRGSGAHNVLHRNKLALCLNLSTGSGKGLFKQLVTVADVVIDNFSPRVMGNLGLDYPVLSQINPGIIQASMPAFGSTGPYKSFVMVGPGIDAMSGLQSITGYPDRPPLKAGGGYTDQTTALNTVVAILAALQWRQRTGRGQRIEVAMREALTGLIGEYLVDWALNHRLPERMGNRSSAWAPQGCYRCSGNDRWVALSVRNDDEWARLCTLIGRPDLAGDQRYASVQDRRRNHDTIDSVIAAWAGERGHIAAMEALQSAGIPAGAVLDPLDMLHDPQMKARGHFERGPAPGGGEALNAMLGFRLPASPITIRRPPCAFGEHTQSILLGLVGLSPQGRGRTLQRWHDSRCPGQVSVRPAVPHLELSTAVIRLRV